eukprot:6184729-Pleurochrysis_carterae.AAC.2
MGTPRAGAAPRAGSTRAHSDENAAANSQPGGGRSLAAKLGFGGAKACERTAAPHAAAKAADAPDGQTPLFKSSMVSQENKQPKNPLPNSHHSVPSKSTHSVPSQSSPSAPSQSSNLVASRKLLFSSARASEPKPLERPVLRSALTVPFITTQPSAGSDASDKEAETVDGAQVDGAKVGAVRGAGAAIRWVARPETLKRQLEALDEEEKEALARLRGEFARRRQQLLLTR